MSRTVTYRCAIWCDHRATTGRYLPVNGFDLVTIHAAIGHSALATAGGYLHTGPAAEQTARFTRAVEPASGPRRAMTAGALGSACIGV